MSGTAPNRIFNIEWRTVYFAAPTTTANHELRLYEGQSRFDVIYGTLASGNTAVPQRVCRRAPTLTRTSATAQVAPRLAGKAAYCKAAAPLRQRQLQTASDYNTNGFTHGFANTDSDTVGYAYSNSHGECHNYSKPNLTRVRSGC